MLYSFQLCIYMPPITDGISFNIVELRNRRLSCSRLDSSAACRHPQNCPPRCRPFHSRISPRFPHGRLSRRSPIKENKVACLRLIVLVLPLPLNQFTPSEQRENFGMMPSLMENGTEDTGNRAPRPEAAERP